MLPHSVILIAVLRSRASDFGLMKIDGSGRVQSFAEKPKGADLRAMVRGFWDFQSLWHFRLRGLEGV